MTSICICYGIGTACMHGIDGSHSLISNFASTNPTRPTRPEPEVPRRRGPGIYYHHPNFCRTYRKYKYLLRVSNIMEMEAACILFFQRPLILLLLLLLLVLLLPLFLHLLRLLLLRLLILPFSFSVSVSVSFSSSSADLILSAYCTYTCQSITQSINLTIISLLYIHTLRNWAQTLQLR